MFRYHSDPYVLPQDRGVGPHDGEEMEEEEDEGWAGHQEEVDYSKEVVFEDSSDEESPKKPKKGQQREVREGRGNRIAIERNNACVQASIQPTTFTCMLYLL